MENHSDPSFFSPDSGVGRCCGGSGSFSRTLICWGRHAPALIQHGGVVPPGGVHVRMAQHVRHQIDIAGFPIEIGAEGAAQFVGTQTLFQGRGGGGVFFDHFFHRPHADALFLQGKK